MQWDLCIRVFLGGRSTVLGKHVLTDSFIISVVFHNLLRVGNIIFSSLYIRIHTTLTGFHMRKQIIGLKKKQSHSEIFHAKCPVSFKLFICYKVQRESHPLRYPLILSTENMQHDYSYQIINAQ